MTQPPNSSALSAVTISVPVSINGSTGSPLIGVEGGLGAELAHPGRELGDRSELISGDDRRDLVGSGIEADHEDVLAGTVDRFEGTDDRRATRSVDRRDIGIGGEDVLRRVEALGLVAVGRQRGDDLEVVAEPLLETGDPILQRRCAGDAFEDGDGVAGLELLGEELAGEHSSGEVVGRHERRRSFPTGDVVVDEDHDDARRRRPPARRPGRSGSSA